MKEITLTHRISGIALEVADIASAMILSSDSPMVEEHQIDVIKDKLNILGKNIITAIDRDGCFLSGGYIHDSSKISTALSESLYIAQNGVDESHCIGIPLLIHYQTRISRQFKMIDKLQGGFPTNSLTRSMIDRMKNVLVNELQSDDFVLRQIILYNYYIINILRGYRRCGGYQLRKIPEYIYE